MSTEPAADEAVSGAINSPPKKHKHRSPNHPMVGLSRAIEMAADIRKEFGTYEGPVNLAHKACKYKEGSAIGDQAVAALKAYGLVEISGAGTKRKVKISTEGDRIVRNAPDRTELIRKAAIAPSIHKEIVEHFGESGLPSDAILRQYLVWDRPDGQRFNEDTVDAFIARFRDGLRYAGLEASDILGGGGEAGQTADVSIGDIVQWNVGGTAQFQGPKQVVGFSEDGLFAYFADSETGTPVEELQLVESITPPIKAATQPPPNPFFKPRQDDLQAPEAAGMARAQAKLDEGTAVLVWPDDLSSESVLELEYWLIGVLRRAKRKAGIKVE